MKHNNLHKNRGLETEEVDMFQFSFEVLDKRPTLLCLSGVQAGMILPLDAEDGLFLVGRDEEKCHLFIDSPEISRHHAFLECLPQQVVRVVDRESKNGTFVNEERVNRRILRNNDKLRFGPHSLWKFFLQDVEELQYYRQLYSHASVDPLTGALNRRSFFRLFERELAFAKRHQRNITVVVCDLDHFKSVNDTYGHVVGDQVLHEFSQRIQQLTRQEDVFARYGGEEFALLLRELNEQQSSILLERLRVAISDVPFQTNAGELRVTVSMGFLCCQPQSLQASSALELFQQTDTLLYEAKDSGRNKVVGRTL